jgi:crotonobetainyl-CoA:carnitine CoA-transferase CaiB-like acyl-CoA transferase
VHDDSIARAPAGDATGTATVSRKHAAPVADSESALPLHGMRIIELANVVAGPSVGKHLSDFGAEVIKVERLGEGDTARSMGDSLGERSAWWIVIGRNKRSITLDLRHPRGREALLRLVGTADALVESFRPGVLERLDLAPETLRQENDRLVVVRVSGFGQTGPYRMRPGFGTLAEAYAGLAAITGYADGPPLLAPAAIADEVAGLFATWALMMALYHRDVHGGPAQTIDVSLFESLFSILGPLPALFQQTGYMQPRNGSRLPFSSPRNVYRTRDGAYYVISGTAASSAESVIELIGGSALLADPRFSSSAARAENADALDELVAGWMAEHDASEIDARFDEKAIPGIRVMTMEEIFRDPHYAARKTFVSVPDEELGEVAVPAPVPRLSATPGRIAHTGPPLGRDTDALLESVGYGDEEIARYRAEGAW